MRTRWVLVVATLVAACDSYSSGPETGEGAVTGRYTGQVDLADDQVAELTLNLTEYLGGVTGSFSLDNGSSGSLTGTVSGSTVSFTISQSIPCVASLVGTATISNGGDRLIGSFSGTSCDVPVNVSFDVTRP
ncbi:MAG TPA: hypothetical protein VFS53_04280 [Gemmatimonadota bacterium]|nr:hypothetical protein [Gemmatimonadota bacterium]